MRDGRSRPRDSSSRRGTEAPRVCFARGATRRLGGGSCGGGRRKAHRQIHLRESELLLRAPPRHEQKTLSHLAAQQRALSADTPIDLDGPSPGGHQAPPPRPATAGRGRPASAAPNPAAAKPPAAPSATAAADAARAEATARQTVAWLLSDAVKEYLALSEQLSASCAAAGVPWATALAFADVEDGGVGAWVRCGGVAFACFNITCCISHSVRMTVVSNGGVVLTCLSDCPSAVHSAVSALRVRCGDLSRYEADLVQARWPLAPNAHRTSLPHVSLPPTNEIKPHPLAGRRQRRPLLGCGRAPLQGCGRGVAGEWAAAERPRGARVVRTQCASPPLLAQSSVQCFRPHLSALESPAPLPTNPLSPTGGRTTRSRPRTATSEPAVRCVAPRVLYKPLTTFALSSCAFVVASRHPAHCPRHCPSFTWHGPRGEHFVSRCATRRIRTPHLRVRCSHRCVSAPGKSQLRRSRLLSVPHGQRQRPGPIRED